MKRDEFDKHHFFGNEEKDEEGKYQDPFEDIDDASWENEKSGPDIDLIMSKTPPHLHEMLTQIYLQHQNEFKSEVDEKPAKLPPLKLQVDETEWHKPCNSLSVQNQSLEDNNEILDQTSFMKQASIIQPSQAAFFSQVHMVRKKEGKKRRFCLDVRKLNAASATGDGFPLPNIDRLLERIGSKKPKYFAVLDLTSGYHQLPLSKESRKYTAFATAFGIFEFLRIPMGLKGAASYFR